MSDGWNVVSAIGAAIGGIGTMVATIFSYTQISLAGRDNIRTYLRPDMALFDDSNVRRFLSRRLGLHANEETAVVHLVARHQLTHTKN